jgi:hypothetical protein
MIYYSCYVMQGRVYFYDGGCFLSMLSWIFYRKFTQTAMSHYMEALTWPELIQPVLPINTASVVGAMVSVYVWR